MTVHALAPRRVERVWGLTELPAWAPGESGGEPIGEIWYEEPDGADRELLVKLLFTAERLSIQVHPDDAAARAIGHRRGKDEAWLVLDAEPGAVIGLGLRREISKEELRAAAVSGEIERLIDWKPVEPGQVYYSPAGTVHAIGAGLTIMEIQQNLDLTYRLYDYGRPRPLHLDDAVEVAIAGPAPLAPEPRPLGDGRELLLAGDSFVIERWRPGSDVGVDGRDTELLLIPLADGGHIDGAPLMPGDVWRVPAVSALESDEAPDLLVAYAGAEIRPQLLR